MLFTALIFGLLGSFHCVGMCGPIAFILPIDRQNKAKGTLQLLTYHLGRLSTYALLGLAFGFFGKRLQLFGLQQSLSVAIGTVMILAVILPKTLSKALPFKKQGYQFVARLKTALGIQLKRKRFDMFYLVGFFNGMLPCGLVYMAVFGSIAMGSALSGASYMIFFGLGTIPLMSTAVLAGNLLQGKWRVRVTKIIPYAVAVVGLLFVLRGMGLNIKYLSPHAMVSQPTVTAQQSCH